MRPFLVIRLLRDRDRAVRNLSVFRIGVGVAYDLAVGQADGTGGVLGRQLRVVGHHDDQPILGDLLEQVHDLDRSLAVQSAGGLVGQEDLRVVDQGPGNGHPLHLAAGELVGLFVGLIAQPYLLQGCLGPAAPLLPGYAGQGQGQLHVGQHGLVGDQVVALEYEADGVVPVGVPIPILKVFGGFAPDEQISGGVVVQTADDV